MCIARFRALRDYLLQVKRKPNPEYIIFAPAYIVSWDDATRRFLVDLSEQQNGASLGDIQAPEHLFKIARATAGHAIKGPPVSMTVRARRRA